ncbi:hypothetical protein QR680_010139 [Steinernema hermaphroditum]|uniref:G-protein coupled receptors family 1 profile domain-containing protein n=1 Tax=Steinernema hermaphroditum TaxID=289476 RepID=A0AA39IP43_9BILA|nr:hypothetical protein QR680_010139 [Steinernema hermaphroditum]
MTVEVNITILLSLNLLFNLCSFVVNLTSLRRIYKEKSQHFTLVNVKVVIDTIFSIAGVAYITAIEMRIRGLSNNEVTFHIANVLFSTEMSMGVVSVLTAVDRLIAIRKPALYLSIYFPFLKKFTFLATSIMFLATFAVYLLYKKPRLDEGYMFYHFTLPYVQTITHFMYTLLFLTSVVIGLFVWDAFNALTKRSAQPMTTYAKKLVVANRIVVCEMAADLFVLSLPTSTLAFLKYVFNFDIVQMVGPITLPLFSIYVFICALSYTFLTRKTKVQNIQIS